MRSIIPHRSLAHRYALALWDVASENKVVQEVYNDMFLFTKVASENPEFRRVMVSEVIPERKKFQVFKAIFEKHITPITLSFSQLVIENGRQNISLSIAAEYIDLYKSYFRIFDITLRTAIPLRQEDKALLLEKLQPVIKGTVNIEEEIDPDLIGGFQVMYEDYVFDASVKRELERFRQEFMINLFEKQY
ncbi:MAG: F-type H+-transporting ATPase subunit delta [Bacteroidales bacterium]|jgi:F-type H+-transporting ATPase subunit delta|nr:F-type H+-transporting ATPase subunit delta [Bacteroidales bacterium]MDN5329569.1 F-type H+-transporting ATPase subunit delta [Bacteroidales bacterium]